MERKNIYISNLTFNNQMVLRQLTKEQAKEEVKKLVDDFRNNYQNYKKLAEPDVETKLVEELFINILGWEKKDFIKQEKVHRGEKIGRADYAFYIGDRIVFFLEAKKIGIPLEKEASYFLCFIKKSSISNIN